MIGQWLRTTFGALAIRDYRVLWIGTIPAMLVNSMMMIVATVVAFDLTGKNRASGLVILGFGASTVLFAPLGGVVADRVQKQRIVTVCQLLLVAGFLATGLLLMTDTITVGLLVLSSLFTGLVFSFLAPARTAWVAEVVPPERLGNAVALQQVGQTMSRMGGPLLAGALVGMSALGGAGAYFVMAALYFVVTVCFTRVRGEQPVARTHSDPFESFRLGLRHTRERPRLLLLTLTSIGFLVAGFSHQVILPGYLEHALGREPDDMGLLLGASGVTGFLAAVTLAGLASSRHGFTAMLGSGVVVAVALAGLALAPSFGAAIVAMLVAGVGTSMVQLLNGALMMQAADPAYHGRVMSLTMASWGIQMVGAYPFGLFADAAGERETFAVMAAMMLCVVILASASYAGLVRSERPAARGPFRRAVGP